MIQVMNDEFKPSKITCMSNQYQTNKFHLYRDSRYDKKNRKKRKNTMLDYKDNFDITKAGNDQKHLSIGEMKAKPYTIPPPSLPHHSILINKNLNINFEIKKLVFIFIGQL